MMIVLAQAWQSWRFARSVLALAAAALAIGIGATTAVYTVVNAVMVKPFAYEHGERFGVLFGAPIGDPKARSSLQYTDAVRYQQETRSFDVFGWYRPETYNLTKPGAPRHVQGAAVTTALAHHLGVVPIAGTWFQDETGVVISSALWRDLGGSPRIVGQPIVLNGRTLTVTGVMPPQFKLPEIGHSGENARNDVWTFLDAAGRVPGSRDGGYFFVYARLKPGVTFAQADADVKRVASAIAAAEPGSHPGYTARFDALRDLVMEGIRPTLLVLLAAASLLFLVGCANVAALLLARSIARVRETAVRVALGASRRALATQFFTEGMLVAVIGAGAGVLVSIGLVRIVVTLAADLLPRADDVTIDWRVLLFTLAAGIVASALSSLAPLWQATRTQPNEVLSDGVRSTTSAGSRRLSGSLVVAELALAFTLLSVGVMLWLHVRQLSEVPPGFDADHLLTFQMTLPDAISRDDHRRVTRQIGFIEALKALPGVQAVGIANQTPLNGCCMSTALFPEGQPADLSTPQKVGFMPVNPGYFDTLRLPLHRGRLLTYDDAHTNPIPVVVNEAAARKYWAGREAIGAFGHFARPDGDRFQVTGVIGDIRNDGLDKPTVPEIYLLHTIVFVNPVHVVVRSTLPPATLVPQVRRAVLSVDAAQPIHDEATMDQIRLTSLSLQRVATVMTGFFAVAALLMAALGIYGVMSYSVRQRTVEFGTRMALGALGRDVLALVLGGGLKIAAAGLVLGLLGMTLVTRWLTQVLELPRVGWTPFVSAAMTISGLAMLASCVPAWRASRLSPMVAMRNDAGLLWLGPDAARWRLKWRRAVKGTTATLTRTTSPQDLPTPALFVDAARAASSSAEALHLALSTLVVKLGAEWVMLLENVDGPRYRVLRADADNGETSISKGAGTRGAEGAGAGRSGAERSGSERVAAERAGAERGEADRAGAGRKGGRVIETEMPASGFLANRLRFHDDALPMSAEDLEAWVEWASQARPEYVAEISALREVGARLAVGLRTQKRVSGVLLLGAPSSDHAGGGEGYTSAERQALREGAGQLALMVENTRLTSRIVEQEVLRRDLALAAEVQRRLLPERPPQAGVATLAAFTIAARNVAGDYYDFLQAGEHWLGIALADVSGKGVAAALIMSVVQASLRVISSDDRVPPKLLAARMNDFLYRSTQSKSYATFFFARVDERTRQMDYVNAGHNPPFLLRPATQSTEAPTITQLTVGGMVLGLFPDLEFDQASVDLESGDVLLIYTDGVTEALNAAGDEFGEDRLRDLLIAHHQLTAQELANRLAETLRTWSAGIPLHDDVTFVVMRVS
jgi:putative ABC transport system permease protein